MEKLTTKQESILTEIKKFIAKKGYSPSIRDLCSICNLSSTATMFVHLKNLTNKGYINQTQNKSRTIELNVPNEFDKKSEDILSVPLLGRVPAGNLHEAIENPNDFFSLPASLISKGKEIFTLLVHGESMIDAGIYNEDIVIVERNKNANNGEIVVAITDENEVTLKRYFKEKDHIRLQPENTTMEPIILKNVDILGKVIGLYRKLK